MLTISSNGYWESNTDIGHVHDQPLCESIYKFLKLNEINNILDLGCGTAKYAKYFISNNIICEAYDGNPNTEKISEGIGKVLDLSKPVQFQSLYDCVMSLEVGEHIPEQFEEIFLDNVCNNTNKWIILSWAIIGQQGNGHVNCKNNHYIIEKLKNKNFKYMPEISQVFRNESTAPWFKNTIMVFQKI
jgi:cyclopropane fatty-acyl-phospholipid synthase-like methyltransferase